MGVLVVKSNPVLAGAACLDEVQLNYPHSEQAAKSNWLRDSHRDLIQVTQTYVQICISDTLQFERGIERYILPTET